MMTTMHRERGVRRVRAFAREVAGKGRTDELTLLLLAAAGVAAGVGLALAVRRPGARRRLVRRARAVRDDLHHAGRDGLARGRRAAESLPLDDVRDAVTEYVEAAREAIADAASRELRGLRKAMRRRRRQIGL